MDSSGGLVGRIGFIAVLVFFVLANLSFIFYQFAKYQSKKEQKSLLINHRFLFTLFVSSLMGMLFFLLVTIFAYVYLKMPGHSGENAKAPKEPVQAPASSVFTKP